MSIKNKLAYVAAIMLMVVTGSNMLEANAWTKFEKLRIAPVHKKTYARHTSPTYRPQGGFLQFQYPTAVTLF